MPAPDPSADPDRYRSSTARAAGRSPAIRLLAALGSAGMAAALIACLILILAAATWYERDHGRVAAALMIYDAPWFALLFAIMAGCVIAAAAMRWPFRPRHYGFVIVHAGLVAVIAGFAAGAGRLDGMLTCHPGEAASRIELPHDRIDAVVEDRREGVAFQPLLFGALPSLPRYLLSPLLPLPAEGRFPMQVSLLTAGDVSIHATALVPFAGAETGFAPAAAGPPAARVRILAELPTAPGQAETVADAWLSQAGETLVGAGGLLDLTLGEIRDPLMAADFAVIDPGEHGRLRLYWQGRRHAVDVDPARTGSEIALAEDLAVRWSRVVVRPALVDGALVEQADRPVNPVIEAEVGIGPAAERRWQRLPVAGWILPVRAPADRPEALFDHPAMLAPAPGRQGIQAQLAIGPDRTAILRWHRASTGFAGARALRADGAAATAAVDLVGGAGGPMRLSAELTWIPIAEAAPIPVRVHPDKAEGTTRWLRIEARSGDQRAAAWIARGARQRLRLGEREILLSYQSAFYDLRREHGFAVRLDRFAAGSDPGGMQRASYASDVTLLGDDGSQTPASVSMNRRLDHRGVTLFQTSYFEIQDERGQPTGRFASVFTAATDPGRFGKWLGSVLVVAGAIILYLIAGRAMPPARALAINGGACAVLGIACLGVMLGWWAPPMAVSWAETSSLLIPAAVLLAWAAWERRRAATTP